MFFMVHDVKVAEFDEKMGDYRDVPSDPIGKL